MIHGQTAREERRSARCIAYRAFNRGHWSIENREHYVRDVTFDEDRSQVRTGSSPQIMAAMRIL
jgi:predicted transposase YbfD/YdcC